MEGRNVLLLVFDTLRPDFLSCYHEAPIETPNFDLLAESGTVYESAYAVGPNTEISHGGIFSGMYPSNSGVVGGDINIPEDVTLLAEVLSEAGYETFGISGPGKIRSDLGYARGFDEYVEPYYNRMEPEFDAQFIIQSAFDKRRRENLFRLLSNGPDSLTKLKFDILLDRMKEAADAKFFAFANFLTCHTPYNSPRPYKETATEGYSRPRYFFMEKLFEVLGKSHNEFDRDEIRTDRVIQAAGGLGGKFFEDPSWLNTAELDVLKRWYGSCVSYLDSRLGEFISALREDGLFKQTTLILTSDHGEHLGEHGLLYHGRTCNDEVLHVPLVLQGFDTVDAHREQSLVSLTDIFPTVCEEVGAPVPVAVDGKSLQNAEGSRAVGAEIGIRDWSDSKFEAYYDNEQKQQFGAGVKCVYSPGHKTIFRSDGKTAVTRHPSGERVDDEKHDQLVDQLQDLLGAKFHHTGDGGDHAESIEENLRNLGYL